MGNDLMNDDFPNQDSGNEDPQNTDNLNIKDAKSEGFRFSIYGNGREVGRAYLFLMYNDLHQEPFGLLEDVFVEEAYRSKGIGTKLVKHVISAAKEKKCYKLICTSRYSRPQVHAWYQKLGFSTHGLEFRIDLDKE